jgi:hypothetical protein
MQLLSDIEMRLNPLLIDFNQINKDQSSKVE